MTNLDRYKKLADYQIRLEPLEPAIINGDGTHAPHVQVTSTLGTLMYLPAEHSIIGAAFQDLPHLIAHIEKLEATLQRVRDLHVPLEVYGGDLVCAAEHEEHTYGQDWPCPTIQTLGDTQ